MSDLLLRRRGMMTTKWEPNLIIGTKRSTNPAGNLLAFSYPTKIRYYKEGVLRETRGTLFNFGNLGVDFGTSVEAMVSQSTKVDINARGDMYIQNGIYAKKLIFENTTSSRFALRLGSQCSGDMIFENCEFRGSKLSDNQPFFYDSQLRTVKFKDCTFQSEPKWFTICKPTRVIFDNINLSSINRFSTFYYNNNLKELSVINNLALTSFVQIEGNDIVQKHTLDKLDFSNNPLLRSIKLMQYCNWNASTKQVFIDFVNSLPLCDEDNRGTLKFIGNPYISDSEVTGNTGILTAKNWDYEPYS